jgi:TIR domain/MalT-like TPR region/NB-ARC domain
MPLTSQNRNSVKLFYSYSHKDEKLRAKLEDHLATLKRGGLIETWHDRKIGAGTEWAGAIDEHLNEADIILLLVSSGFLASDYCSDVEVVRALERHEAGEACVIPVILRPCDWGHAPFGKLQALPEDGVPVIEWPRRDAAFLNVTLGIRETAERLIASGLPGGGSRGNALDVPRHPCDRYEYDIFISYASTDAAYAFELADALSKVSRVFVDRDGLSYREAAYSKIPAAQKASRATAALISSATYYSIFQRREIADAIRLAARSEPAHCLIPVFLEEEPLAQYTGDRRKAIFAREVAGAAATAALLGRALEDDDPQPAPTSNTTSAPFKLKSPVVRRRPRAVPYLPVPTKLAGRQDTLRGLLDLLSSAVRVISVDGMGGIGKTSLVASLFEKAEQQNMFEASSWSTCRGNGSDFESFLSVVADDTGSPVIEDFEETLRSQQVLRHISFLRALIVVDAVEKMTGDDLAKLITFAQSVPATSKLILVGRYRVDVPGAVRKHVGSLDLESTLDMIEHRIGDLDWPEDKRPPRADWVPLYKALDGNPWFILSALAHIDQTGVGIGKVVARLKKTQPQEDFAHIFGGTFEALTEGQKIVLSTLTLSGRPVSRDALQWITELAEDALSAAIGTLHKTGLLERSGTLLSQSYYTHQLTNYYADVQIDGGTCRRADLRHRYVEFYCALAERHGGGLHKWDCYKKIDAEFDIVMHALSLAFEDFERDRAMTDHAVRFGMSLTFYFELRGFWDRRIQCCRTALDAALACGRNVEAGWMCLSLGWTCAQQGAITAAREWADRAMRLLEGTDDLRGLAYGTRLDGIVAFEDKDFGRAHELFSAAIEQIRPFGDHDVAIFLNSLAKVQRVLGRLDDSSATLQEVLRIAESASDPERVAGARRDLARLCLVHKQTACAREHLTLGLQAARKVGRTSAIADCLNGLTLCCDSETETAIASRYKSEATELYGGLGVSAQRDFLDGSMRFDYE